MKKNIFFFVIAIVGMMTAAKAQVTDTIPKKMSIVSGGVKWQANVSNLWAHNVPGDIYTTPHFGGDLGGFIDFNVTKHFFIQLNLLAYVERCVVRGAGAPNPLMSVGLSIPVYLMGRFGNSDKGYVYFGGGPYTEFVLWARMKGENGPFNPYHHVVGMDEETGDDVLALSDNHSGLGVYVGYEFPCGLQINAAYQYSFSDIFAFEHSEPMSLHPQKATVGLAWRFGRR